MRPSRPGALCLRALCRLLSHLAAGVRDENARRGKCEDGITILCCYNRINPKTLQGIPTSAGSEGRSGPMATIGGQLFGSSSLDFLKFESVLRT